MSPRCKVLLILLISWLACLCEEASIDDRLRSIQVEIESSRKAAEAARGKTEALWKRHCSHVAEQQKKAEELNGEIERLAEELERISQGNNDLAAKNAALKEDEARLAAMLELQSTESEPLQDSIQKITASRMERLGRLLSSPGEKFAATAIDENGIELAGYSASYGPITIFFHNDGIGQLFQEDNAKLPKLHGLSTYGRNALLLDITGRHPELLSEPSGFARHLKQGGIMMIPIIALALLCIGILAIKIVYFMSHTSASELKLLDEAAQKSTSKGEALEDELFALAQDLVSRRERLLFWLSVSATAAPLLGLLGTVTGMIHTFSLITAFGVGDARLLSDGISEALVTTEAGLCVAIPALLCHAWLSRLVRGHSARLERKIAKLIQ
ncbi:MAG: MotA/TolQ/ExbB proton channel family protein [Victivallales bacterium]|nr:MotA/TolQ/ExbB proton channel family protein [Victivallales bacterium]